MSISEDKSVNLESAKRRPQPRRRKLSYVSDAFTRGEVQENQFDEGQFWAYTVGRALEIICLNLGKDKSVQITDRSWKQLQRYFEGQEVPAGVIVNLAAAAGVSTDYILNRSIVTYKDTEIERRVIDRRLAAIRNLIDEAPDVDERKRLMDMESAELKRSAYFMKIGAILIDRPNYMTTLEDFANPAATSTGQFDPDALVEIWKGTGVLPYIERVAKQDHSDEMPASEKLPTSSLPTDDPVLEKIERNQLLKPKLETARNLQPATSNFPPEVRRADPTESDPLDEELLGRVVEGIMAVYKDEGAGLPPRHLGQLAARLQRDLLAAGLHTDEEKMAALRFALEQLRRELRSPEASPSSSKRLA